MQFLGGVAVFSPSDLVSFLACEYLIELDRLVLEGKLERPTTKDAHAVLLAKRGTDHERRFLQSLKDDGRRIVEIELIRNTVTDYLKAEADTAAAMAQGADVIYQGTFFHGGWAGRSDFLLRVPGKSRFGAYHYEVADTKLTRKAKGTALLQMAAYSDHVTRLQGASPEWMYVVTGDRQRHAFRVADFAAYLNVLQRRLESSFKDKLLAGAYPVPVEHCATCRWAEYCEKKRKSDDHLSLVAGMRRAQMKRLGAVGVKTVADLAAPTSPARNRVKGIGESTLKKLREQADLQVRGRTSGRPEWKLLEQARPDVGLGRLPTPSPGDIFFDMEGDPLFEDGLEYLFGIVWFEGEKPRFKAFWAHTRAEEKSAFENFIDFAMARLEQRPDMHIYHYASYERSALTRLMARHSTREAELDRLLRGEVLVDLYKVVVNGLRISQDSYSIKALEPFYMEARAGEVTNAASSIVAYESYLDTGDKKLLDAIERYNEFDCVSTWKLRGWLEERRAEYEGMFGPLQRPEPVEAEPSEALKKEGAQVEALRGRLLMGVPEDERARTPEQHARWVLAQLIGWHRREAKPKWWAHYDLRKMTDQELFEDSEALSGLAEPTELRPGEFGYRFDPHQDHKIFPGCKPLDPFSGKPVGTVLQVDSVGGTLQLKKAPGVPHPLHLIPPGPIPTDAQREALFRIGTWVADHGMTSQGNYQAIRDLLLQEPPRVRGQERGIPLAGTGERAVDAARRTILELEASYLPARIGPS